jgi:hypothetical protein
MQEYGSINKRKKKQQFMLSRNSGVPPAGDFRVSGG